MLQGCLFPTECIKGRSSTRFPQALQSGTGAKKHVKKLLQELDIFHLLFLDLAKVYTGVCQMGTVALLVLRSAIFPKVFMFFLDSLLENA